MKKHQIFTFDGITSVSLCALLSGFGEQYFICSDIDFQSALYLKKKNTRKRLYLVMFLALAYKEDSTGSEGLKDVGKVFLQY